MVGASNGLTSGYLRSGNAQIFYESTGEGRPVFFAHAGVADRRMWDPQFEAAAPGHRYVRSDMRGFGNSEWFAEPYSPHSDILAVIESLDLRGVVLVGCSMGGRAVMEVAVTSPDRVDGLVVVGTGLPGWKPKEGGYIPPQWADLDPLWKAEDWEAITTIDADVWGVGVGRSREQMDQGLYELIRIMDRRPVTTEMERDDHMSWMEPPISARLDELAVPAMVVVGAHDLPDVIQGCRLLAGRISDRDVVVIPDAAHLPNLERPEVFNPVLAAFLSSLSE